MSTYQIVIRNTATAFRGVSLAVMYERFLGWWVSLYATPPRNPRPMI
jgi:hypothetical protein